MAEPILEANTQRSYAQPTDSGYFGEFGGRFVAETLTHALDGLAALYAELKDDPEFKKRALRGSRTLCRAAHTALFGRAYDGILGWCSNLSEARRP